MLICASCGQANPEGARFCNGCGTSLATTYREQLKDTWHAALNYRFENRGWKIDAALAHSQSRRRTLSARDGHDYFGTTNANLTNLVLRGEGFSGVTDGVPPTVTAVDRAGQPVDIRNGRLYTLNSATSPEEPLMTNHVTTLKLSASRALGLPFLHNGIAVSRRFIRDNADTVRRYVKSQIDAVHVMKSDRRTSVAVLGKYMRQTANKEILERSYELSATDQKYPRKQYPSLPGIQTVLDAIADENPKAKSARPEQFVDVRFVKELDDSGYIDRLYKGQPK